jgi:hypothetical protein
VKAPITALLIAMLTSSSVSIAKAEPAPAVRLNYVRVQLSDGRILFAGGSDDEGHPIARAEIYSPANNKLEKTGAMIAPRCGPTATLLPDGTVFIVGGALCSEDLAPVRLMEIFDPREDKFREAGSLIFARYDLSAILLRNGKVLLAQGYDADRNLVPQADLYNTATGKLEAAGSMVLPRCFASMTQLSNGAVLFTGGARCDDPERPAIKGAEIYDPATKFKRVGDLGLARVCHTATLLKDGKVLIAGGSTAMIYGVSHHTAEIYDPERASFTPTGDLTKARSCASAILRDDGTVIVKGGYSRSTTEGAQIDLIDSEIYDPKTGKFTAAALAQ